jgi:hypothetical protein
MHKHAQTRTTSLVRHPTTLDGTYPKAPKSWRPAPPLLSVTLLHTWPLLLYIKYNTYDCLKFSPSRTYILHNTRPGHIHTTERRRHGQPSLSCKFCELSARLGPCCAVCRRQKGKRHVCLITGHRGLYFRGGDRVFERIRQWCCDSRPEPKPATIEPPPTKSREVPAARRRAAPPTERSPLLARRTSTERNGHARRDDEALEKEWTWWDETKTLMSYVLPVYGYVLCPVRFFP